MAEQKGDYRVPDEVPRDDDGNFVVDIIREEDNRLMESLTLSPETFPVRVQKQCCV